MCHLLSVQRQRERDWMSEKANLCWSCGHWRIRTATTRYRSPEIFHRTIPSSEFSLFLFTAVDQKAQYSSTLWITCHLTNNPSSTPSPQYHKPYTYTEHSHAQSSTHKPPTPTNVTSTHICVRNFACVRRWSCGCAVALNEEQHLPKGGMVVTWHGMAWWWWHHALSQSSFPSARKTPALGYNWLPACGEFMWYNPLFGHQRNSNSYNQNIIIYLILNTILYWCGGRVGGSTDRPPVELALKYRECMYFHLVV